jgi:hypothetical protein
LGGAWFCIQQDQGRGRVERSIFFGVFKHGMMVPWRSPLPARCHRFIALFAAEITHTILALLTGLFVRC